MTPDAKRDALLNFLDVQVFLPALNTGLAVYADAGDRKLLANVKKRVERSRVRYQQYGTATEVAANFLKDLDSKFGRDLSADMWSLKVQRFEDIKKPFLSLCSKLGV
jgi:hypothetical protein